LNEKLTISYNSEGARVKIKVGITPSIWLSFRRLFIHFSDMKKKKKKKKKRFTIAEDFLKLQDELKWFHQVDWNRDICIERNVNEN